MASKKRLKVPGITIEKPAAERAAPDEPIEIRPERLEEVLIEMDRMVLTLPPGISRANGVTIDREAVHAQLQHYIRLHEDVRRTQRDYDDALVRLALSIGKWGQA